MQRRVTPKASADEITSVHSLRVYGGQVQVGVGGRFTLGLKETVEGRNQLAPRPLLPFQMHWRMVSVAKSP